MPSTSTPAIETRALGRRYGRRWALVDLNIEIARGSVAMLTGHNGSGKSTLLRVLATALHPDRGQARVDGHDVSEERLLAQRSTALLGHHLYLYEALSAIENLQLAARFLGAQAERAALVERLAQVGLAERGDDPVTSYSAGMRKRLALARMLLQTPQVVLLDEPYGELDPAGFRLVDELLIRLRTEGRTVLMATHLVDRGRELCDLAVALEGGRLTYVGPAAQMPGDRA
jgi:heme exporter protein A